MTTDVVQIDRGKWISNFLHKTAATQAGLGWIGKNCLLITQQYGGAVRLSSILTDHRFRLRMQLQNQDVAVVPFVLNVANKKKNAANLHVNLLAKAY